MKFESSRHCKLIRLIGVPLGLWPYRRTILVKLNGVIALTIIALYIAVQFHADLLGTVKGVFNNGGYLQLAVIITHEFNIDLVITIVNGIIPPVAVIIKYFTFAWYIEKVKYMFEWIQSNYDSLTDEKELRMLEKSADRATNICMISLYLSPAVLIFILVPLLPILFNVGGSFNQSRSVLIPITVEYFVDPDEYFFCIMFHIDATMVVGGMTLMVTESITIHFVTHACGLLELTGERVERVLENSILNILHDKTDLSIHEQLVATIQLHQRALKFIEFFNTTFTPHYTIIICIAVLSLSINFYIVSRAMLLRIITTEIIIALVMITVLFVYMGAGSYVGQVAVDKGDELFTKTYCARWYAAPVPVQKTLLYIRQRSMQPIGFRFVGLYTGSLELFSKLVNTSMSYFTVLYSTA